MKAAYLIPILAVLLIGCQGEKVETGSGTTGGETRMQATETGTAGPRSKESKPDDASAETQPTGAKTTKEPSNPPPKHVESVQRKFHLKDLERVTLKANGHDIKAWVMDTEPKRQEGMMFLTPEDVAENDGMIFVFPDSDQRNFWMENTSLPLDIIYISEPKFVMNIQEGKPFDETNLPSSGKVMYVLEMRQGAAKRLGIMAGTQVTIPDSVKGQ
ncbi:MAG TPA: DUF192 domain-containing protein [Fimbriimonadaceae bacterium]|nr:DUF192 domain-containing protein [Fimbriimonadaceae bacterium]